MPDRVSFPFERVLTPIGFVWIPVARVTVSAGGRRLDLDMIVDTGADLTMIPRQIGSDSGFRAGRAAPSSLCGISGGAAYFLKSARLSIGPFHFPARVAWVQSDDAPILLGRTDALEKLVVEFDGPQRRTTMRSRPDRRRH